MVQEVGGVKATLFQHVGADPQGSRWNTDQNYNRNHITEGTIEEGSIVVLKANFLEVLEAELTRPKYMLEELIQEMERAREEIRSMIRKTKLMIVIGFLVLIAFQMLLRWIRF
jgi:hypothetical protein